MKHEAYSQAGLTPADCSSFVPRLRNDLYSFEWDVKLYYIPYRPLHSICTGIVGVSLFSDVSIYIINTSARMNEC